MVSKCGDFIRAAATAAGSVDCASPIPRSASIVPMYAIALYGSGGVLEPRHYGVKSLVPPGERKSFCGSIRTIAAFSAGIPKFAFLVIASFLSAESWYGGFDRRGLPRSTASGPFGCAHGTPPRRAGDRAGAGRERSSRDRGPVP